MAGYVSLLSNVRGPDSLRRVLPRSGSSGCALTTARERDEALARYTTLAIDENGEWWLPALRLAAASALLRDSASPLAAVLPVLLERCAAELIYAGGATVPWVSGRCERVPQAQMNLPALGVRPSLLSQSERVALDERGFINLGCLLSDRELDALRQRLAALWVVEGSEAGLEAHQERGAPRLSDLVNKGACFDVCWSHPKVLAAFQQVMGTDFKVNSLNARLPLRGQGQQDLHVDWGPDPVEPTQQRGADQIRQGRYYGVNSLWCLDDWTEELGATRVRYQSKALQSTPLQSVLLAATT